MKQFENIDLEKKDVILNGFEIDLSITSTGLFMYEGEYFTIEGTEKDGIVVITDINDEDCINPFTSAQEKKLISTLQEVNYIDRNEEREDKRVYTF